MRLVLGVEAPLNRKVGVVKRLVCDLALKYRRLHVDVRDIGVELNRRRHGCLGKRLVRGQNLKLLFYELRGCARMLTRIGRNEGYDVAAALDLLACDNRELRNALALLPGDAGRSRHDVCALDILGCHDLKHSRSLFGLGNIDVNYIRVNFL